MSNNFNFELALVVLFKAQLIDVTGSQFARYFQSVVLFELESLSKLPIHYLLRRKQAADATLVHWNLTVYPKFRAFSQSLLLFFELEPPWVWFQPLTIVLLPMVVHPVFVLFELTVWPSIHLLLRYFLLSFPLSYHLSWHLSFFSLVSLHYFLRKIVVFCFSFCSSSLVNRCHCHYLFISPQTVCLCTLL